MTEKIHKMVSMISKMFVKRKMTKETNKLLQVDDKLPKIDDNDPRDKKK